MVYGLLVQADHYYVSFPILLRSIYTYRLRPRRRYSNLKIDSDGHNGFQTQSVHQTVYHSGEHGHGDGTCKRALNLKTRVTTKSMQLHISAQKRIFV